MVIGNISIYEPLTTINDIVAIQNLYRKYGIVSPSEKTRLIMEYQHAHVNMTFVKWLENKLKNTLDM